MYTTSLATRPGHTHRKNPPRHAENSDVSPPLTYAPLTASRRSAPRLLLAFALPLPFCHAVYQDRLRKDVKKMIAVATVPFLSLISFQRLPLPSAGCRGSSGSCRYLARSLPSRCCRCCWGGCWRRHTWASEGRGGREEGKK